ncbi:hypothetical protein B9479_000923 [Cryptococcus floricola]|uniref:Uncharacterized protein n=1 Tax=Cryptococcus floricola TaxID=2591691 RepID=A0A5D3B3T4_9TREE|nr:hypothetical protein B9479_000923 [Cryptococcus floricola]
MSFTALRALLSPSMRISRASASHFSSSSSAALPTPPTNNPSPISMSPVQSDAIPKITPTPLSRDVLVKLHKLSALHPPPEGSAEEAEMMEELGELVGLMDLVKQVELPQEEIEGLLGEGIGAIKIGQSDASGKEEETSEKEESGKKLLAWSPTRVGDFYSSALKKT